MLPEGAGRDGGAGERVGAAAVVGERGVFGLFVKLHGHGAIGQADILVVCTPTLIAADMLRDILPRLGPAGGPVITDVASVKGSLRDAAIGALGAMPPRLVLAHPIAGSELSGVTAANSTLFRRHKVILTPLENTDPQALTLVSKLWSLLGAVVVLTYLLLSYCHSRLLYRRATPVLSEQQDCEYRLAKDSTGPYIAGLITPRILLPHDFFQRYDVTQQQLVLQHELTHWRRGDLHLNYLALLLMALCWFNPICWLAYRYYRQAQELSCDALVISNSSTAERIAYGRALLSSTQQPSIHGWPLTHHYGDYYSMKQRILQLQQQQGFSKTLVLVAMAAVLSTGLLINQPVFAGVEKGAGLAPTMRIEPRYPLQAAQQGISGYVQIKFDVDGEGNVQNAQVIKAMPEKTFEKEAVKAIMQWKYNATGKVHKEQLVQLDFELDTPADMERINVTPQQKSLQ